MITKTYNVSGMTCEGCKASVKKAIAAIQDVDSVAVDLETGTVNISSYHEIPSESLKNVLPSKYSVTQGNIPSKTVHTVQLEETKSDWRQLFPLFLIFFYITVSSFLMNANPWSLSDFMLDFMGLFYIVFSFFKFLDYKGFPASFSMYDPLAKLLPAYGWIYPFLEVALGLMFLFRFQLTIALLGTLLILGVTTIGVTRALLSKKAIQCACLGTALQLPMTKATFIENTIMIVMAVWMLATSL